MIIAVVVLVVLAALVLALRRRGRGAKDAWATGAVRGELLVTGVQEQWRTGNANDDKINREYDVRLQVDATLNGSRLRYDVTVVNRDAPRIVPGARFPCDVLPSDPAVARVYLHPGAHFERFENGRPAGT